MTRGMTAMVVLVLAASPVAAQELPGADKVREAMQQMAGGRYQIAFCSANKGLDNRAQFAANQLKVAIEDKDAAKRAKASDEAFRTAAEAVKANPKSGGAWYYYGRIAFWRGDVVAGDSAFSVAEKLVPDCETDIDGFRQNAWAPLVNSGIDALNSSRTDEAIGLFRTANTAFRKRPEAVTRLAVAYAQKQQVDSAVVWFTKAIEATGTDTAFAAERSLARFNLGATLQQAGRFAESVAPLKAELEANPTDVRLMRALANSYRRSGNEAEAKKLEDQSRSVGTKGGENGINANDLFDDGANAFTGGDYAKAAELFGQVLELEPWNREARFNQSKAYYLGKEPAKLVDAIRPLIAKEPYNELAHQFLIEGLRDAGDRDGGMKAAEVFLPLPVNVDIKTMSLVNGTLGGSLVGRDAKDLMTGKVIPPKAMTLVFSFTDETGAVIATAEMAVPVLKAGTSQDFSVSTQGKAFKGFSYTAK